MLSTCSSAHKIYIESVRFFTNGQNSFIYYLWNIIKKGLIVSLSTPLDEIIRMEMFIEIMKGWLNNWKRLIVLCNEINVCAWHIEL